MRKNKKIFKIKSIMYCLKVYFKNVFFETMFFKSVPKISKK